MSDDAHNRLDRLEARLEQHQETITEQRVGLAELQDERIDAEGAPTVDSRARSRSTLVPSRGALTVSGILTLVASGVGPASADPQGEVGAADQPVEAIYTAALHGPLTGGVELTSLVGDGLIVENGTLTTDGEN